jgi:DNA-nicking Smr family endonuclease
VELITFLRNICYKYPNTLVEDTIVMTKNPKDLDIWLDFIAQFNKQKSMQELDTGSVNTPSMSKDNQIDYNEWSKLTGQMDRINDRRGQYISKQTSAYIKEKPLSGPSRRSEYLMASIHIEESVLPLDRFDKQHLKKIGVHHMAVIDLHGYTLPLAYERLKAAFQSARHQKARILRVITGKGRTDLDLERPTLRQIFPKWMQETYFQSLLIKVRKAPLEYGGEGAFLVYLRQSK